MGGTSSGTTAQVQQSRSEPWAPTQPLLQNDIIPGIHDLAGSTFPVTPQETQAFGQIQQDSSSLPNYIPQGTDFINQLFGGGGPDRTSGAEANLKNYMGNYNTYQGQLQPYLSQDYLDPTKAPGIQAALETVRNDAANSTNSMFAGAGRDLSPGNTQATARGIAQAEAPLLLGQYNTNVNTQRGAQDALFGGAGSLYGAGNTTTGLLSGLDQTKLGNQGQAFNYIPQLSTTDTSPYATLNAQNMQRQLPLNNYASLLNLLLPISGLGGQVNTTSNGTSQNQMSGAGQFATIASGIGSLLPRGPTTFNF